MDAQRYFDHVHNVHLEYRKPAMTALAIIAVSMLLKPSVAQPWASIKDVDYLADRTDSGGVVAVTYEGSAYLLGPDGKVQGKHKVPKDTRVLRYEGKSDGRSPSMVAAPALKDLLSGESYPQGIVFGQGPAMISIGSGCTVTTSNATLALPPLGPNGAIGVRSDGKAVAFLECPMYIPILVEYALSGREWARREPLTPMIEEVGFAQPLDRFSDFRYIGENVVYIGSMMALRPISGKDIGTKLDPLDKRPPLELEQSATTTAMLFAVNLRTRITRVVASVKVASGRERGGPRFGKLAASFDSKFLYLVCKDGVERIDTAVFTR